VIELKIYLFLVGKPTSRTSRMYINRCNYSCIDAFVILHLIIVIIKSVMFITSLFLTYVFKKFFIKAKLSIKALFSLCTEKRRLTTKKVATLIDDYRVQCTKHEVFFENQ